jgi:hypothetical protein
MAAAHPRRSASHFALTDRCPWSAESRSAPGRDMTSTPGWLSHAVRTTDRPRPLAVSREAAVRFVCSTCTPGSSLPSRDSSIAGPPVETRLTRSRTPKRLSASSVFPPPTTVRSRTPSPPYAGSLGEVRQLEATHSGAARPRPRTNRQVSVRCRAPSSRRVRRLRQALA